MPVVMFIMLGGMPMGMVIIVMTGIPSMLRRRNFGMPGNARVDSEGRGIRTGPGCDRQGHWRDQRE